MDPRTGEIFQARPEYVTMSRRPGIAAGWIEKFNSDVYTGDFVVVRGVKMRPPRYYDKFFQNLKPLDFEEVQFQRFEDAKKYLDNNTKERLNVRRQCQEARLTKLVRPLEA